MIVDIDSTRHVSDLSFGKSRFSLIPYKAKSIPIYLSDDESKNPKVVNNKVSFTRQVTIKYSYDGKTYELKSPKMKENIDIKYNDNKKPDDSFFLF
ncbi:MAG: hypothetical protein LBJ88_02835 [Campylobacteraceae bacterium]|jgi:hypothetical protein|nr:hypothetical protein [Campylobacteraceae bacterium]